MPCTAIPSLSIFNEDARMRPQPYRGNRCIVLGPPFKVCLSIVFLRSRLTHQGQRWHDVAAPYSTNCSERSSQNSRYASDEQVLYDFDFDWRYMVRGLTIDKRRGNVLKLDRHKYVKLAYHGFQKLSREQRLATYANALVRSSPHLSKFPA